MPHREDHFESAGGAHIHYQLWEPDQRPRALIIVAHGAAEHSGRYRRFAERFLEAGYSTAALDHVGHGRSAGHRGHVDRFSDYLDTLDEFVKLLRQAFPDLPLILLGHSMGGLISCCYLLQNQRDFAGCVLSGPAIKTDLEPPWWQTLLIRLFAAVAPRMGVLQLDANGVSRDPLEVREYLDDPLVYGGKLSARKVSELFAAMHRVHEEAGKIELPILLMHGEADRLTSPEGSRFLYEHVGSADKTLKLYPGLYHEIFNEPEREQVFADLQAWLDSRLDRRGGVDPEPPSDDYILYGAEFSLYSGKARAYLRYKGLPFEERLATRRVYKEVIVPGVGAPIIPVLSTPDGELVQDTTDIIDFLERRHPEPPVYPAGPRQKLVALMLEHYGDEWLVIPAMHYRWSVLDQQYDFIMGEFGGLSAPEESPENRIAIGEKTSAPFRGSIVGLGVNEDTVDAIESEYLTLLDQLSAHFASHRFLLGDRPCIADFGFIGPLYAHLGRDPVPRAIMEKRAPAVYGWVQRMQSPSGDYGDWLPDDGIPDTLIPILKTLCRDFLPDVLDVVARNAAWLEEHPGEDIPRYLGMHTFRIGDVESERVIHSYSQWMFQRPRDHYQSLSGEDRAAADALLERIGGLEAFNAPLPRRVRRKAGQLQLVEDTSG